MGLLLLGCGCCSEDAPSSVLVGMVSPLDLVSIFMAAPLLSVLVLLLILVELLFCNDDKPCNDNGGGGC